MQLPAGQLRAAGGSDVPIVGMHSVLRWKGPLWVDAQSNWSCVCHQIKEPKKHLS